MSYLLTSTPSNVRQATSDLFKTYRNPNQIPGPVGHSGIVPLSTVLTLSGSTIRDNCGIFLAATMKNTALKAESSVNVLKNKTLSNDAFSSPDLVVSFAGRGLQETVSSTMYSIGFTKQSSGHNVYYRGPASQNAVNICIKAGGDLDTSAPFGSANIS